MPRRVERLEGEGITRIRAGWGWAIAIRDDGNDSAIFTWGLNSLDGRLGLGSIPSTTAAIDPRLLLPSDKRSLKGMRESSSVETPMRIYEPQQVTIPLESLGLEGIEGAGREGWVRWKLGEVEGGEESMWVCLVRELKEGESSDVPERVGEY